MKSILITCPAATCAVPEAQRELFKGHEDVLTSSQGWQPGALNLAQALAIKLRTPLIHSSVTRLLVDPEELGDERFSSFCLHLQPTSRERLAERYATPFLQAIEQRLEEAMRRKVAVIHFVICTANLDAKLLHLSGPQSELKEHARRLLSGYGLPFQISDDASPAYQRLAERYPAPLHQWLRLTANEQSFLSGKPVAWSQLKSTVTKLCEEILASTP